jgi:phage repressor protein C with HTH and peptisase S24 domain
MIDPRARLAALIAESGQSYGALSRMLRRNDAYLQQYVRRGTPRVLAENDRRVLAAFFRVPDTELGGPPREETAPVRRLAIEASAGPGALAEDDRQTGATHFDPRLLAQLGVRASDAAEIRARGTSMAPSIEDGDLMLVDQRDRRIHAQPAVFVIRLEGTLMVKRVARSGTMLAITSDNPEAPPIASQPADAVDVIGRVVWLSRALR